MITDVNINKLHQPWRSFDAIINKYLSGKSTGYDSLRLSQAQIIWGMYHKKNVDFSYLLWEDFVYQVEHKESKKSNEMYYPHFTKIIVNFFMTKDQSIPRKNKVNWYFARDDHMFTTINLVSRHQNTQNVRKKQSSSDTTMPPLTAKGKRLKTSAKVDKLAKEKQPAKMSKAKGLTMLSEVALTETEQMKLATKQSLIKTHISHASGSGTYKGTGIIPGVLDVPTYESDDEEISWKSSEEDDDDEVNMSNHDEDVDHQSYDDDQNDDDEQTDSDNNGDDFIHPKFSTRDDEDKKEESFDPIVRTPSHDVKTDDEDKDEDSNGMNVKGDEMDDEGANEEYDVNELYIDMNINFEGQDIQMADVQTTQVIEDTHVTLTLVNPEGEQQSSSVSSRFVSNMLNPSLDTGIDSIFNLNTELTPRVDVLVTTTAELPLLSATTLPPPPTPIIPTLQQTPVPSSANVPSSSLQDLPNFESLFGFDHRLNALEINFSEFM
nr:hypothetical protein [Tanacetum cinerariifolium]